MKMNKVFAMIGILVVAALTIMTPAAAMASNTMTVYVPERGQPVSEDDVLTYAASQWQAGYMNELFTIPQATMEERMDWFRQQAMAGFDPNTADPYLYSLLLPNAATLPQVSTWFGHPVVMMDGNYVIKDWFGPGNDATVAPIILGDVRTEPLNIQGIAY